MKKHSVGFIGLGRMGFGMASNLAKAGVSLTVYDARPEPMEACVALGATLATDPADLASRVEHLFLCLPSETEVDDVLFGSQGVVTAVGNGLVISDTTTMNHGAALQLAEKSEKAGWSYSDCPISGMPFRAENGTLTMMFGGSSERFDEARPYLDIMGEFIVHCGEIGMGQLMKAVNNIIYNGSRSFASEYFVPRILERKFDGDFSLQAAFKDIVNIQQAAARVQASTPVVDAMITTYQAAIDMGLGDQPKSAMVKVYERQLDQEVSLS
jgi:3-hydroxyisobutyrate dehydrogenase-like beta-hydroxyacid dehydrogenase